MTPDDDARLADITAALFSIATLDFTKTAQTFDDGSALDGVAGAVNMLSEELRGHLDDLRRTEETLRRSDEQLRHAQKMEAIGRLAGGIAHDFNNLLSVILSYGDLLLSDLRVGDPMRADIAEICKAGRRGADLTKQLLIFSRQEVVVPKVLDLNSVLGDVERMLARLVGAGVNVVFRAGAGLRRVKIDRGHVEQILMNLAVNARDAMPNGGELTIETANVDVDEKSARSLGIADGPHVVISVSDTGTGIDKATKARIFEPFFTTKEVGKGTGLGLSTVFGIVQQSRGSIVVDSELGRGTTFEIYLPRVDESDAIDELKSSKRVPRGTETILLVEDEGQVRTVVSIILRRVGYTVIEATSAGEALVISEKHAGPIDLLLSDVVMPHMSGIELAARFMKQRPHAKVLCMSGYTDTALVHHSLTEGIPFLQKPIAPADLTNKIRELLDQ